MNNSEKYQFVVLPLVNQRTSSGSKYGQNLEIKGTGFSLDPSKLTVSVDGVKCDVSESTLISIKCRLAEKKAETSLLSTNSATPSNQYNSGSGFFYQRYNLSTINDISPRNIKKLIDAGTLGEDKIIEQYISG